MSLTIIAFAVVCLTTIGLKELAVAMADPFGDDVIDFQLEKFLAAMYQKQLTSPTKHFTSPQAKQETQGFEGKTLERCTASGQEGKVALDLLPEDINSIMSQSTTPFCPICNKDCANFPNLRSHLQV